MEVTQHEVVVYHAASQEQRQQHDADLELRCLLCLPRRHHVPPLNGFHALIHPATLFKILQHRDELRFEKLT